MLGWVINRTDATLVEAPVRSEQIWEKVTEWDELKIKQMVKDFSEWYEIDYLVPLINCESEFQNIQSNIVTNGVREESYGIAQINLPSHDVTKEQALDPYFSIRWTVKKIKKGEQGIWSCYHKIK